MGVTQVYAVRWWWGWGSESESGQLHPPHSPDFSKRQTGGNHEGIQETSWTGSGELPDNELESLAPPPTGCVTSGKFIPLSGS